MKRVHRSVLLWYSAAQMYDIVTDVASYPLFLPWCEKGEVLQQHPDGVTARVHLQFAGLRHAFTTRNVQDPGRRVDLHLVDGPFRALEGHWRFEPLAAPEPLTPDEPRQQACSVDFTLDYDFSNRALAAVLGPVFDKVASTFVDGFVERARQLHGAR